MHHSFIYELMYQFFPHTSNIQSITTDPMFNRPFKDSWTGSIDAASHRLTYLPHYRLSADWTMGRHNKGFGVSRAKFLKDAQHFRDNFPSFADDNCITNADI